MHFPCNLLTLRRFQSANLSSCTPALSRVSARTNRTCGNGLISCGFFYLSGVESVEAFSQGDGMGRMRMELFQLENLADNASNISLQFVESRREEYAKRRGPTSGVRRRSLSKSTNALTSGLPKIIFQGPTLVVTIEQQIVNILPQNLECSDDNLLEQADSRLREFYTSLKAAMSCM